MSQNEQLQIKAQSWTIGVIGSFLITVIGFVGLSFDARLSKIEGILMQREARVSGQSHELAHSQTQAN